MKTYGKKWSMHGCVIRHHGGLFQVEFNHNGKRERQSWPTLKEAKVYAKQKSIELLNEGGAAFELSLEQRQDAAKAFKLFPGGLLTDRNWMNTRWLTFANGITKFAFSKARTSLA